MRRKPLWLLAPVLVLAVAIAALLSLNVAFAKSGSAAPFDEGTIVRSSFSIGRGVSPGNIPDEVTADYWLKVGAQGEEESLKATLTDSSGTLIQEGIRNRADGVANTYLRDRGEVVQTIRPKNLSSVMWTQGSVNRELLKEGFELVGEKVTAGVLAQVYEQRSDIDGIPSVAMFEAAGLDVHQVSGVIRRVYIGTGPFGVDLGEEGGYALADGSEFIPYYRRVTAWEVLNEAPAGAFEWSPSVAGEVIR